jgi:uncharacterized protein YggE
MRPLALALLLLACAALTACSRAPAGPRGVGNDEVLLQVAASGRSEARPDQALFTAGVSTTAATAAQASAQNNATMTRVVSALEALEITGDDLQTRAITLARIEYGPQRGRFTASNTVEVTVRDLKQAGPAIAAATEAGGNVLSGPDLRVSSPEAADNLAYAAAYKAARARADAYAAAAGMKVVRVLGIKDGTVDGPPIGYAVGAMNQEARASAPPARGGVDIREVTVRADFALAR